ncbi:hypothetical protein H171_0838 [[Clostridium] celerecrescens 18A]|uniref:Uncharacterized protein n=1 Tax=[Clostridium] celerecrescens 18A TaxID=1286362 RepID=A0A2M8Z1R9_9FIRM|nr:hypothetical protein H171_0838 [[Clostridium] celerecrescens 18A]
MKLEKMEEFFDSRLDGYEDHELFPLLTEGMESIIGLTLHYPYINLWDTL